MKLSNKRVMYGSDSGFVGLANTVNGNNIFGQQVGRPRNHMCCGDVQVRVEGVYQAVSLLTRVLMPKRDRV